mmetsp:Transcript_54442/g.69984  ORF Transcript_54442/g.69984 Transcript_54442/m.69984 type:complete len:89 (+) Transcript_54442:80-346(+)
MSLQEDLEDIIPAIKSDPFKMFNGMFDQFGKVVTTFIIVFLGVIAFIIYIIHLYDTGKLGPDTSQRKHGNYKSQGMRKNDEKWAKKNL